MHKGVEGRPWAVVRRRVGRGRVLLSGVHWEVSSGGYGSEVVVVAILSQSVEKTM